VGDVSVLISKILIGFDGTDCARRALLFGLDLAEKYSASVLILNVLELPVYGGPEEPLAVSAGMAGFVKDLRDVHEAILSKAVETATKDKPKVAVASELREGDPSGQIVAAALDGEFDVVVVGHGGEGRLRELFLGGTSERVAHLARCAVIIVK
jgi:nucleotide-binding universal stress UspA family protein